MYQWREDIKQRKEVQRNRSRTVTDYKYTSCWVDSLEYTDSKNFKDQKYNMNKAPRFKSEVIMTGKSDEVLITAEENGNLQSAFQIPIELIKSEQATQYVKEKIADLYPGRGMPDLD